jgi:hypothetical protein
VFEDEGNVPERVVKEYSEPDLNRPASLHTRSKGEPWYGVVPLREAEVRPREGYHGGAEEVCLAHEIGLLGTFDPDVTIPGRGRAGRLVRALPGDLLAPMVPPCAPASRGGFRLPPGPHVGAGFPLRGPAWEPSSGPAQAGGETCHVRS